MITEADMAIINNLAKKYGYPTWAIVMWDGVNFTLLSNTENTNEVALVLEDVAGSYTKQDDLKWN